MNAIVNFQCYDCQSSKETSLSHELYSHILYFFTFQAPFNISDDETNKHRRLLNNNKHPIWFIPVESEFLAVHVLYLRFFCVIHNHSETNRVPWVIRDAPCSLEVECDFLHRFSQHFFTVASLGLWLKGKKNAESIHKCQLYYSTQQYPTLDTSLKWKTFLLKVFSTILEIQGEILLWIF